MAKKLDAKGRVITKYPSAAKRKKGLKRPEIFKRKGGIGMRAHGLKRKKGRVKVHGIDMMDKKHGT